MWFPLGRLYYFLFPLDIFSDPFSPLFFAIFLDLYKLPPLSYFLSIQVYRFLLFISKPILLISFASIALFLTELLLLILYLHSFCLRTLKMKKFLTLLNYVFDHG